MKKVISGFLLFGLMFSAMAIAAPASESCKNEKAAKSYLFVQSARQGALVPINVEKGFYQLKLADINKNVAYFTDRPARLTGLFSVENFLKVWQANAKGSFIQDAPNVAVSAIKAGSSSESKSLYFIATLSNPVYDSAQNNLTYTAHFLEKSNQPNKEIKFDEITLFFDDASCPCALCCELLKK